MPGVILEPAARQQLASFVERRAPGAPYRRRATILLLADDGRQPAEIAPVVGLPARQVRLLLRAFRRQGLDLFPAWVLRGPAPFAPETGMAEAGRVALAAQLGVLDLHEEPLRATSGATAVHETRKAIRRTRTLFKLLAPYFAAGAFRPYRRCLKQAMRVLGRARDLHVALSGLEQYLAQIEAEPAHVKALASLQQVWQAEKARADEAVRATAGSVAYLDCLKSYRAFVETSGAEAAEVQSHAPGQVRHQAAVHVYQRLAAVRAFSETIATSSVADLHRLRLRFKELRYTLEFFAPLLGREIETVLADLNEIQDHLGALNDARVALSLLAETAGAEAGVARYRAVQEAELQRLLDTFGPVWDTFNAVAWRRQLAAAVAEL